MADRGKAGTTGPRAGRDERAGGDKGTEAGKRAGRREGTGRDGHAERDKRAVAGKRAERVEGAERDQGAVRVSDAERDEAGACADRHLRFGWASLLVFLTLGLLLESLHGLKVGWYLDVGSETRREMWTLAHAHGTLLGLANLAFAWTTSRARGFTEARRGLASRCLRAASLLMPAGFFLGGLFPHEGDPGLGILLLPVGGALLLVAVVLTLRSLRRSA